MDNKEISKNLSISARSVKQDTTVLSSSISSSVPGLHHRGGPFSVQVDGVPAVAKQVEVFGLRQDLHVVVQRRPPHPVEAPSRRRRHCRQRRRGIRGRRDA